MSGFRNITKPKEQPAEVDPTRCEAIGCPGRASVSVSGSRYTCAAHAHAPIDKWRQISEAMIEHKWLIEFIDEMRLMQSTFRDWRAFASQFWGGIDDFCLPHPSEEAVPYQNRMRGELLWRVGAQPKRPQPRIPEPVKPAGHFARRAAA